MPISDVKEMLDEADQDSFVDIEFPPVMSSICEINEPHPFSEPIIWRRAYEFLSENGKLPQVFSDDIKPDDILQGKLGDCWLMCGLACLAEQPSLVRRLFVDCDRY